MPQDAVVRELRELLLEYEFSPIGAQAQAQIAGVLEERGFSVEFEAEVPGYTRPGRRGARRGFVDLVATRDGVRVTVFGSVGRYSSSIARSRFAAQLSTIQDMMDVAHERG